LARFDLFCAKIFGSGGALMGDTKKNNTNLIGSALETARQYDFWKGLVLSWFKIE